MALDLVQIGFEVEAKGLDEANRKIDGLIDKFNKAGEASAAAGVSAAKGADRIIKKQELMGEFLPHYNKSTASLLANFRLMESDTSKLKTLLEQVYKNESIESYKKQQEQLIKQQEKQTKAVADTINQFEKLSQKSFGGGILDFIDKQSKGLSDLRKEYQQVEKAQNNNAQKVASVVDKYEALSRKSFGGGILDSIDKQSKGMKDLVNQYKQLESADKNYADSVEKRRQQEMKARQDEYQKTMDMLERQRVAEMQARQDAYVKSVSHGSPMQSGSSNIYGEHIDKAKNSLGSFDSASKKAEKSYGSFLGTLGNIAKFSVLSTAVYMVINSLQNLTASFITTADEMQNLNQRISLYTPNGIKLNDVMERLGNIATQNRVTLADTGKLYTQLLPPIQRLKGSTDQALAVVDAFGKAMLVGGANTREAAAATVQFGQAMASGKLAGDEFRSLAEASPRLLQAIADGSGIAAQKLKEMSAAGKLTSGLVSSALLDQFIQLQLEAAKMGTTVSAALNEGMVAYQQFVDEFNKQTGMTDNLVSIIRSLVSSAKSFGDSLLKSLNDSNSTLNSFLGVLKTVWDLVGAVVSGFIDVVGWVIKGGEKVGLWKAIFDSVKFAVIAIVDTLLKIPFVIVNIGTQIAEKVLTPFEKFIELAARGLSLAGFTKASNYLSDKLESYNGSMNAIKTTTGDVVSGFNLLSLGVDKATEKSNNFKSVYDGLSSQLKSLNEQEKKSAAMSDKKYIGEYVAIKAKEAGVEAGTKEYELIKQAVVQLYSKTQEMAKQAKLQGEIQAKEDAAAKAREKYAKDSANARKNYQEQIDYAQRLQDLLALGVDFNVAKIASQKDYIKGYGTNLAMAKEIVALEEKLKAIEDARQKQQQEKENKKQFGEDIEKQLKNAQELSKFIKAGFNMDVSSPVVDAGFKADANGFKMVGNVMTANLTKQAVALQSSARLTEHLLELSRSGRDLDEVKLKQQIYTNSKLSDEVKLHQYNLVMGIIEAQKYADLKEAQLSLQTESNAALKEAAVYAQYQNNELAAIAAKYKLIDEASVSEHKVRQNILEKVKEQNEYLKQQKENPFANVDFEVFGDFGNPFKSALDGLNSLLTAVPDLEDEYKSMFASLDEKTKLAAGNKEELAKIDATRASLEAQYIVDNKKLQDKSITGTLSLAKSFFKENSKGYKIVSGLEKAYQASKIAFALWEKKDYIATLGMKIIGHAQEAAAFVMGSTTKIAAQSAQNVVQAQGAVASAANAPPPVGFAAAAAMIALLAGIGIAIGGGSSGSFAPTNEGTGTVFGDKEAKSESIKKSIDLLADNSRVELPLTAAMLKSLRNIENNIGGLTNLLIRNPPAEGLAASIGQGFKMDGIGKGITGAFDWVNKLTFGLADMFTLGLFSAFGKLLGGAFGKKVSIKGQGLYGGSQDLGGIVTDGFNLQEYVDIQTKKKSFGITTSTKNSTRYSKADQELANQFGLIFKNFYDTILMAASPLDQNLNEVTTKLNNFVVEIGKINLKGLNGEQIQEKLNAVFGAAADNIARAAIEGLDDFQKVGEGYFETLVRVASGIESANAYTSRLNVTAIKYTDIINKQGDITVEIIRQSVLLAEGYKGIAGGFYDMVDAFDGGANELVDFVLQLRDLQDAIYATGKSGDYLTTSMFLGAGGLDRLSNGLEAYFEMLSPAEQAAELTRRLTNEFAIFGLQLPADIKAFRNLVNGIDISTESGQKLYGQVIALAPEFNDLQDSLENANSAVNDLVKSLRDLAEEARKARGETQQPRNLASIRSEFDATAALAMQGDMTAAQKLLTLGKDLMQVSKQYSVSGSEYAKDLATIQKVATVSADVQELGLGYTPTTSLTPLASAGTQTVETVNSTTDAKLEALRADLITAITAVAKYTQDTAQRLQRWDYGDKMNVHVEQEVGDSPIKVQTV